MSQFTGTQEYVASEELMASVNIAIALKKPLLIKGEPGTGKTMLAEAVAKSLGKRLLIWNIKSTTKAQEGLYVYDTIQRLYDGQFGEEGVDFTWEDESKTSYKFNVPKCSNKILSPKSTSTIIVPNNTKSIPFFLFTLIFTNFIFKFPNYSLKFFSSMSITIKHIKASASW